MSAVSRIGGPAVRRAHTGDEGATPRDRRRANRRRAPPADAPLGVWPEADFPRTRRRRCAATSPRVVEVLRRNEGERKEDAPNGFAPHHCPSSLSRRTIGGREAAGSNRPQASRRAEARLVGPSSFERARRPIPIEIDESALTEATTIGDVERLVQRGAAETERSTRYPYPRWAKDSRVVAQIFSSTRSCLPIIPYSAAGA